MSDEAAGQVSQEAWENYQKDFMAAAPLAEAVDQALKGQPISVALIALGRCLGAKAENERECSDYINSVAYALGLEYGAQQALHNAARKEKMN